jgi:23S rRNA (cytidine1920-2'-O)/16S rRNA (cytidine1409-2'-O)-methyltransferase
MDEDKFVSRAGLKLDFALDKFKLDVNGLVAVDLGCNVGGFTDCLLQRGVSKVYAVDTSYGTLDWNLRNNQKVVVLERTNAIHLNKIEGRVDIVTVDVGWTMQEKVLPNIKNFLKPGGLVVSLIKLHYEAPRNLLKKGHLPKDHIDAVLGNVISKIERTGFKMVNIIESPIVGKSGGNTEFLVLLSISNLDK